MQIFTRLRWSMLFSNKLSGDIHESIYDCKDATSLRSWVFIDSSYTPHHISMVAPLNWPSYCTIAERQPIGCFCFYTNVLRHNNFTFDLLIYSRLHKKCMPLAGRHTAHVSLKYLIQEGFSWEIISHPVNRDGIIGWDEPFERMQVKQI